VATNTLNQRLHQIIIITVIRRY